ncbi:MAG: DUF1501 domain-containing protein [Stellaceae bacterium]|jgi:uncharacterized protein (DUF1501 family)
MSCCDSSRRDFLALLAGSTGAFALAGLPGAVFAAAPGDRRLVVVLLRGAMDGLAAVAPVGDRLYAEKRGSIALKPPGEADGAIALNNLFALHPALAPIEPYYRNGELLIVHASGNGYHTRSHFDAQDLMESGLAVKHGQSDGWLNRALALLQKGNARLGLAVGGAVPLVLRGPVQVASWEPEGFQVADSDFITALGPLYAKDTLLGPALKEGVKAQSFSSTVLGDDMGKGGMGFGPNAFKPLAESAGKLLAAPDGPRIAALDMGGWDTHVNQGAESGRLAQNFAGFADGLDAMAQAMGPAWKETVLVAVTEFGRTVAVNGNNGTDHGTASALFVMGGRVKGGRVAGDWPGLDRLEEDRDLRVAVDSRTVMKGILRDHLGIDAAALDSRVFPDTTGLKPFDGLIRA